MFIPLGDDNNSGRRTTPFIVYGLIAANAAMWLLQLQHGQSFTYGYSAVPFEITHNVDLVRQASLTAQGHVVAIPQYPGPSPIYLTLLSAMFMHGGWMHILGNMLYLFIFGDQIEDFLGHVRFLIFYLLCGFTAAAAQIWANPDSVIPTLGASGAIAGVLGAYLIKYPRNSVRVLMFRFVTHMPAAIVLGFWFVLQILSQAGSPAGSGGGVAYMAHIGGFVAGVILVLLMGLGRDNGRPGFYPGSFRNGSQNRGYANRGNAAPRGPGRR